MTSQPIKVDLVTIGAPMASHRIHAGHLPFIYTRGKIPAAIASSRSTHCVSARGMAKRAGIIILMFTPVARVVLVTLGLLQQRDLLFGLISAFVLAVLASSVWVAFRP